MSKAKEIFLKEFKAYFYSPIAYIVISVFLAIIGWLFYATFFLEQQASLSRFFSLLPITFSFIIPAITMRLFSEEINQGSYELLLTLPVSFRDIIVGKFLAAVAFIGVMLSPTLIYAVSTTFIGDLDWGPVIGGYFGAMLLACAFVAVGLLASTLTRNQVVAFIIGMTTCFLLTQLINFLLYFLPLELVGFFQYFSAQHHFDTFAKGIIDTRDILYFLTISFVALYGANLVMEEKK